MTILNLPSRITTALLALLAAACTSESSIETASPRPLPQAQPAAPASTTLELRLVNAATGSLLTSGTATLLEDRGGVVDTAARQFPIVNGSVQIPLAETRLSDADGDGVLDTSRNLRFSVSSPDGLTTVIEVPVSDVGINVETVPMIAFGGAQLPGVGTVRQEVNLEAAAATVTAISTAVPGESLQQRVASVTLPRSTQFVSDSGVVLDSTTLSVAVSVLDASQPESLAVFPGGFSASIDNPNDIPAVDQPLIDAGNRVNFVSGGFVAVEVRDAAGNVASRLASEATAQLRLDIAPDVINPRTGERPQPGDAAPIWSLDSDTGTWRFEQEVPIQQDEQGRLFVEFETNHFSYFNMDWLSGGQSCSGNPRLRLVGTDGQPLQAQLNLMIRRAGGGYGYVYRYVGDGYVDLFNATSGLVDISLLSGEEFAGRVTRFSGTGQVLDGTITNVNVCQANGATMTVALSPAPIKFSAYPVNWGALETNSGQRDAIFRAYLSRPSAVPLTVSYTISGNATPNVDFIPGTGSLTFPAGVTELEFAIAVVGDNEVERDEYFELRFVLPADVEFRYYYYNYAYHYILNDDLPALLLADIVTRENDGAITSTSLRPRLAEPSMSWITVSVTPTATSTATPLADYLDRQGDRATYFYFYGDDEPISWYGTQSRTISILGDADVETRETVEYNVAMFASGRLVQERIVKVLIDDDGDAVLDSIPSVRIGGGQADPSSANEATGLLRQVVRLSHATSSPVSVTVQTAPLTAQEGSDFQPVSQRLTFPPGTATLPVNVALINDRNAEYDSGLRRFAERLQLVIADPDGATIGPVARRQLVILDDDIPYVYLAGSYTEVGFDSSLTAYVYPVSPVPLTLEFSRQNLPAGSAVPAQVTLPAAAFTQSIGIGRFPVGWRLISGRVVETQQFVYGWAYVYPPPPSAAYLAGAGRGEEGSITYAYFALDRYSANSGACDVHYSIAAGDQLASSTTGSVSFGPDDSWMPLVIEIADDGTPEPEVNFTIYITGTSGNCYAGAPAEATASIEPSDGGSGGPIVITGSGGGG